MKKSKRGEFESGQPLYPPSPDSPLHLATPSFGYRVRVVLVLVAVLGFVAIYLGLLLGSLWLAYHSWSGNTGEMSLLVELALKAISPMLVLFFAKGLVQRDLFEDGQWVEVSEHEQPDLHAFVRKICAESNSPLPGRIFLSWEANAMVMYPSSLLSLFWPTRKNLLIGMGLVNGLDLSELKAVLAHEFGHISQSSTKLGQFVYVANQVCLNVVCGRDRWDLLLARWRACDLILSWPAWILTAVVAVLRAFLTVLFYAINRIAFSLKRRMEFNADLHAVRLCGSDAIVSGLWKSERCFMGLELATNELASLAQHRRYSNDIFHQHDMALARLNEKIKQDERAARLVAYLLRPYRRGAKIHFPATTHHSTSAWDAHPSTRDREKNAKRIYVDHPADERPAWILIRNPEGVRACLSLLFYRALCDVELSTEELLEASEVSRMIDEEQREMRQGDHYAGFYQDRHIRPGKISDLTLEIDAEIATGELTESSVRGEISRWIGSPMQDAAATLRSIHEELAQIQRAHVNPDSIRKNDHDEMVEVSKLVKRSEELEEELQDIHRHMHEADRAFFRYFYWLASRAPEDCGQVRTELTQRYEFLEVVQDLVTRLHEIESRTLPILHAHGTGANFSASDLEHIRETFSEGREELEQAFRRSAALILPKLAHLDRENSAASFVLPSKKVVPPLPEGEISAEWIQEYLRQFEQVLTRLRKLHFKNLGKLLRLQEQLDPDLFPREQHDTDPSAESTQNSYA